MAPLDLDALSADERRAMLRRLLAQDASALRTYPASFVQERLWLLSELEPGAAYHVYGAFALDEPVDPPALSRALEVVVGRHDVLRTSFALQGGALAQVVADRVPSPLRVEDLSSLAAEVAEREATRLVQAAIDEPFAKNRAPLLRVVLVRLPAGRQVLALTLHHCVADLPSRELLVRELLEVYRATLEGREARLPALPVQYAEHAVAERRAAEQGGHAALEAYWRERLMGLERGDLPLELARDAGDRSAARHRRVLDAETTERVRELARRLGVTPFMTLLAGWAALQARVGGSADACVGTPVTTRDRDELAGLIGPLIDTLPLRLRVDGARSFEDLLADTRAAVLADFDHRGLPFDRLVEALRLPRDPSRPPLFDVFFVLEDHRAVERSTRGVAGREWPVARAVPAFPLTVEWTDSDDGLACVLEYDACRVQPGAVAALAGRYVRLLAAACAQPTTSVRRLPVLTDAERTLQASGWNQTALALPAEPTVFDLFRAQVGRTPARVAARCGDEALTYAELERWTRGVAGRLTSAGCVRGDVVGVCCERGLGSLAALLGVMRTGAAYLPVDPRQPPARAAMILRQAGARLCLVTDRTADAAGDWDGRRLSVGPRDDGGGADDAHPVAAGDDRAYVIYTSGSSGTPKGVEVRHRAVVSCLVSLRAALGLRGDQRVFAHTTPSFDIAAVELFLPLLGGGEVVIARPDVDALALGQEVMASGAQVVQATPSGWRSLLDGGWRGGGATTVLCGGEPLGADLARRLLREGASVWNLYGPTETTIWSTAHRLSPGESTVPVGRPLGNTVVYVLDADGELVPVGTRGEVCIGGEGLARGYLGDPELTARRFVADPFRPGQRLYRTGDVGRQRADGALELEGRLDDQVKLRGHRVELGEVESCLAAHPALTGVAVVVQRDDEGEARLLACYTSAAEVGEAELRAFVRARLPEVMVPAVFVRRDTLPTTPSGKIDRRALARHGATPAAALELAPPATPTEVAVAAAFEQVLGRRGVGRHDNFFDLGGHSLLVPAIVARLVGCARRAPTPMDLFRYPSVAALASALDGGEGRAEASSSIAARAGQRREAAEAAAQRGKEARRGRR